MKTIASLLLAAFAGSIQHLGFSPYFYGFLQFLSVLLFAWLISRQSSKKLGFVHALCFALPMFLFGVGWVYTSMYVYGQMPWLLAVLSTFGFCALLAVLFALPWTLLPTTAHNQQTRLWFVPIFWLFTEWLRSWFLTGFPWLFIGYSQVDTLFSGWLPVFGVLGSGFLYCLITVACLSFIYALARQKWHSATALATIISFFLIGSFYLKTHLWTQPFDNSISVTLVQPNVALTDKWIPSKTQQQANDLERLSAPSLSGVIIEPQNAVDSLGESNTKNNLHLIVWPEAAIPYLNDDTVSYLDSIQSSLDEQKKQGRYIALISGMLTYREHDGRYLNSIVGIGTAEHVYHKQRLVPFGEYVPLENWFRGLMYFFDLPMSIITKGGPNQQPLVIHTEHEQIKIAPAICYEIAYGKIVHQMAKNSNLIITLSNDAWFGTSIGPWQHMQMARARALEHQKPLLRVTNNGITAVVSAQGQMVMSIKQFEQNHLNGQVTPRKGQTPFAIWGRWPLLILSLLSLLLFFCNRVKKNNATSK